MASGESSGEPVSRNWPVSRTWPASRAWPASRTWKAAIFGTAALAFLCKILLALNTFGTNDVYAWERFGHWSRIFGATLYDVDPAFNHPPSMMHVLRVMLWLTRTTAIPFQFWLRLPAIVADGASLWIVSRIFADRFQEPAIRWGLLLLAASPALILVSGYHGNTDPVMMFFVLLSAWRTQADLNSAKSDLSTGAAFGAALCVKVLPLVLLPAFFFYRPGLKRRATFLASAAVVILICWMPYLYRNPAGVFRQVIGYHSIYGDWGVSWLLYRLPFFQAEWHELLKSYGAYVLIAGLAAAAWFVNRSERRPTLYAQAGATLFLFLAASNGFGVQYLAWLAPWIVGVALVPVIFFTAASGAFLFLTYNYWAGGLPWFLSDANYMGDFSPHLDYFLVLCWISVIVLAWVAWKPPATLTVPRRRTLAVAGAVIFLVVLYPVRGQLLTDSRTSPEDADRIALTFIRADEQASLSDILYYRDRYAEAVVAARTGLAMDATHVHGWNSLGRACIQLGRWDEALNAAEAALRLAPDDEAANQNRAMALGHR